MSDTIKIQVLRSGFHSSIQDGGRKAHLHEGIPQGGYMDRSNAENANWLVGNRLDNPLLEITLLGPKLIFQNSSQIAITGRFKKISVNNKVVCSNQTISISAGDILDIGQSINARGYLAINGSWKVNYWLGSCSSLHGFLDENIFGKKGQNILIIKGRTIKSRSLTPFKSTIDYIRITKGPEWQDFNKEQRMNFLELQYQIDSSANRHAYRLNQESKILLHKAGITSSGVLPGTIQVTPDGQPIILMKDAQTTGGYRRIAQLIKCDLDTLARFKAGDLVQFKMIPMDRAISINRSYDLDLLAQMQ